MRVFQIVKKVLDRSLEVLVMVVMAILVLDVLWQVFTRDHLHSDAGVI